MAQSTRKTDTADTTTDTTSASPAEGGAAGNTAVNVPDHDRVSMLSLKVDGTPDQTNPEMIGDPEAAKAATREQFRQQAVSAEDVRLRGVTSAAGETAAEVEQDPTVQKLIDAHDKVAEQAEKAADAAVDALHTGESEQVPDTAPGKPNDAAVGSNDQPASS